LKKARELFDLLRKKNSGTDWLVRSLRQPNPYYNIRDRSSRQAAEQTHRDPEIHALWVRLDKVCCVPEIVCSAGGVPL
jgi:hypothetical protein